MHSVYHSCVVPRTYQCNSSKLGEEEEELKKLLPANKADHLMGAVPVQWVGGGLCDEEACSWECGVRAGPAGAILRQDAAPAQASA